MSDPSLSTQPGRPHRFAAEPAMPPLVGRPRQGGRLVDEPSEGPPTTPKRAPAAPWTPTSTLSGYEQIRFARAASTARVVRDEAAGSAARVARDEAAGSTARVVRDEAAGSAARVARDEAAGSAARVARDEAAGRQAGISCLKAAPAERGADGLPLRARGRHMLPVFLTGLLAAPALALLALVWIETTQAPLTPTLAWDAAAQDTTSFPDLEPLERPGVQPRAQVFAAPRPGDHIGWTAAIEPEPPSGSIASLASSPDEVPEEAAGSLPLARVASGAERGIEVNGPDTDPTPGAPQDDQPPAYAADASAGVDSRTAETANPPPTGRAPELADTATEPAPAPVADAHTAPPMGEMVDEPPPALGGGLPGPEPAPVAATALAAPGVDPPAGSAALAGPPDSAALAEEDLAQGAGGVAGGTPVDAGGPPAVPPGQRAAAAVPPPSAGRAAAKTNPGEPPRREARAGVVGAPQPVQPPSPDPRCRAIVLKAQLGEETNAERSFLRSACGARR